MPKALKRVLEPRKTPVQARSTASVEATLDATVQVLLAVGKERLTTTLVARRAGVSVGTLYQYFPNKSALLRAVLKRHLDEVRKDVEVACQAQHGKPLTEMAAAVVTAFLEAKMRRARTSVALYSVSDDVDGATMSRQMSARAHKAMTLMLQSSPEPLATAPEMVATMLQGAMFGVSRRLLESGSAEKLFEGHLRELIVLACAYVEACSVKPLQFTGRQSGVSSTL